MVLCPTNVSLSSGLVEHDKPKFVGQGIGSLAAADAGGPASEGESAGGSPNFGEDGILARPFSSQERTDRNVCPAFQSPRSLRK
jgi:hypothetical protein